MYLSSTPVTPRQLNQDGVPWQECAEGDGSGKGDPLLLRQHEYPPLPPPPPSPTHSRHAAITSAVGRPLRWHRRGQSLPGHRPLHPRLPPPACTNTITMLVRASSVVEVVRVPRVGDWANSNVLGRPSVHLVPWTATGVTGGVSAFRFTAYPRACSCLVLLPHRIGSPSTSSSASCRRSSVCPSGSTSRPQHASRAGFA